MKEGFAFILVHSGQLTSKIYSTTHWNWRAGGLSSLKEFRGKLYPNGFKTGPFEVFKGALDGIVTPEGATKADGTIGIQLQTLQSGFDSIRNTGNKSYALSYQPKDHHQKLLD